MDPSNETFRQGCLAIGDGRYDDALALLARCLEGDPDDPDLLNAVATALDGLGRREEALVHLRRAISLAPHIPQFHHNLANVLRRLERTGEAEGEYRRALSLDPLLVPAIHALGTLLVEGGRPEEGHELLLSAVERGDASPLLLLDLGVAEEHLGDREGAERRYRAALSLDPRHVPSLNALGMLLLREGRVGEARDCFSRGVDVDPAHMPSGCNLAVLESWTGNHQAAIGRLERLVAAFPDDPDLHFNLALAHLTAGSWQRGWEEYEWRFRKREPVPVRHEDIPRWRGESLEGKRILVHAEQGYGDAIQFVRYATLLAERGAEVIVEGQDERITPLLAKAEGVSRAFPRGDAPPCRCDLQIPMMSIPSALGEAFWPPPSPPFFRVSPESIARWEERLAPLAGVRVGIAWAGRPEHRNDPFRTPPAELFGRLASVGGISWVSLQFSPASPPTGLSMTDFTREIDDFSQSAALVSALDLVVSIDSAVAHLAAALGLPVLLVLPWNPDWRWSTAGDDSPWYPSVTLYRQKRPGCWDEVLEGVVATLRQWGALSSPSRESGARVDPVRFDRFLERLEREVYPEGRSPLHDQVTERGFETLCQLFPIRPGIRVLDVGCGQGPTFGLFRAKGVDLVGITLSEEDVRACRERGYRVMRMDQSNLLFPDGWFDLLWARHVIEHSPFPLYTLAEFRRVLKPGGVLYLEVPAPETSCRHETNPNHYSVFGKSAWLSLIDRSGFQVCGDVEYSIETLAGPDRYWGFFCVAREGGG